MNFFSSSSTLHSHSTPFSPFLTSSFKPLPEPNQGDIRRPQTLKASPTKANPTPPPPGPKKLSTKTNPLRDLVTPSTTSKNSRNLSDKLWLSSKISPPPPPPIPEEETADAQQAKEDEKPNVTDDSDAGHVPASEFRQEGKIFVGNLPLWIKKNEVAEFFRQFGPIKNVVLIKGHDDPERNVGYGFIIYGGPTAAKSASDVVEYDGVEFHGRTLTMKLDDGRRLNARSEERARWVAGSDVVEYRSKWHERRENS